MRVATVDGLVTLFYDGSESLFNEELEFEWLRARGNRLRDAIRNNQILTERMYDVETLDISNECKKYRRERETWQQIIVMEGVTEIPRANFKGCKNVTRVIFANTVIRIEPYAFFECKCLVSIKWSLSLEYIGDNAFKDCNLLTVFIPRACREICDRAFGKNKNLSILHVPQDTELGRSIVYRTALAEASPFETSDDMPVEHRKVNKWIKNMNNDEEFALHRACSSFQPMKEVIHTIIQEKGLKAFKEKNSIGITPSQYLKENPYTDLTEKEIIRDTLMKLMGEVE